MADIVQPTETKNAKQAKSQKRDYIFAVGRRKAAVARVRLYEHVKDGLLWGENAIKKGDILVNNLPISQYFSTTVMKHMYIEPLRVTNTQNRYTFTIQVAGGGKLGQLEAAVGGIAQALVLLDPQKYKEILRNKGFLTVDSRVRERRTVGTGGKARRKKQSPKR